MSYVEERPVIVDVDADLEMEGRARLDDDNGLMVKLVIRTLGYKPENRAVLDLRASDWRAFVRSIERAIKRELE